MLAKKYRSEVISIENPFEGIYTLEFEPEKGKYKFLPGQFLHVGIDDKYDGAGQWPESRCFSIQSAPGEKTIKVTYAVKGEFTSEMEKVLKVGSEVWLKLPYGDLFQQPHSKDNTVFIAGGTGITPYLSLFNHSSFNEYRSPKAYLGFRSKQFHIYQEEIDIAIKLNPSLDINTYFENIDGILNIDKIYDENGDDSTYFISGPPIMIKTFKQKLLEKGVADSNVRTDDWE